MNYNQVTLTTSEKIGLIGNISTMLAAGISIMEVVNSLLEDTKGNQRKVLEALKSDLQQGKRLHASFSQFPRVFDKVTINLLKAAEEAGTLEITLKDLKAHIQKQLEFTDKVKFAMIYPVLILFLFLGVLLVMLLFVIPKISTVFSRLKVSLPLPTRILIFVSDLLIKHTLYFAGGLILFVLIIVFIYRTNRQRFLEFMYRLPLISSLVKQIDLTSFTRSMYLLLSSGLPIVTALELSEAVVLRQHMSRIIEVCRQMVTSGRRLTDGLRLGKGYVPSLVVKLIEAGEKSGTLDKSMQEVSEYLDYEVTNTLKTITAVMEPVLLVIVGVSVGAMMLAIITPIYGLIGQVGNR